MKKTQDIKRRSDCPISFGLDVFGDKWTLLILRDIMFYHRTRFSDFAPNEHIATNILTDRLHKLERLGLIQKTRDAKLKNQNIYTVTKKGADILPILIEMTLWGLQHDPMSAASAEYSSRLKNEKKLLTAEVSQALQNDSFLEYRRNEMGVSS